MIKQLLILSLFFTSFITHCQQGNLFDTRWYATEMVVDGNAVPIPVLSSDKPDGCFVGIEITSDGNNDATIDIALCGACYAFIKSVDSSSFISEGWVCLLCMDCGPCNPYGTSPICTQGFLTEFESNQFNFYDAYGVTFTYTITPIANQHFELKVDKPNGDYIIYNTEETLSIQEIEIISFSIVPNPTTSILTISGLKSEIQSVVIYTLNGNKLPIVLDSNSYDASYLATGIYFISITNVDGKTAVQKFIKK